MLVILSRKATLLIDERILSEYRDVLSREKFGFDLSAIENWLQFFADEGILVTPEPLSLIIPDRTDLPFLEVATAGRADYLVTGNIRHFPKTIATKLGLTIISPAQFMDMN
jgi:predicted nucleic acid-binding protein